MPSARRPPEAPRPLRTKPAATPGRRPPAPPIAEELLATAHLVLPAYLRRQDCARLIQRFEGFRPASLIMTRLDDCDAPGGLLGEAYRRGLPVSYCANGPAIPEDIQEAEASWLASRVLGRSGGLCRDRAGATGAEA